MLALETAESGKIGDMPPKRLRKMYRDSYCFTELDLENLKKTKSTYSFESVRRGN